MENRQNFTENNNLFASDRNEFDMDSIQINSFAFEEGLKNPIRPSMNWFEFYEGKEKYDLSLKIPLSNTNQPQKFVQKFDFEINPFKEQTDDLFDSFSFFDLDSPVEKARSYEYELTSDFDLSIQKLWFSDDMIMLSTINQRNQRRMTKNDKMVYNQKKLYFKNLNEDIQHISSSQRVEGKKSSSSSSQLEVPFEKVSMLMKCLQKSKGVDATQIDIDLIARTMEFGQEKVAQQLRIPYRRYKSILNKCGIKTSAGRKVNNLRLEMQLVKWAMQIKANSELLTRKMIKDKANELSKEDKNSSKTNLSKGWLDKFVKRHEEIKVYLTSQKGKKGL